MPKLNRQVYLTQDELCVLDGLLADRLKYLRFDRDGLQYKFLRRLKRKIKRNIKVKSFSYNVKKKIIFVKS